MLLEQNIKGLCQKNGIEFDDFLSDLDVEHVNELSVYDLEAVCEEYEVDLTALLFKPLFRNNHFKKQLDQLKLLISGCCRHKLSDLGHLRGFLEEKDVCIENYKINFVLLNSIYYPNAFV